MDTRQVATLLKIAHEETKSNDFQYILSLNQNVTDNLEQELEKEEFDEIINDNIVLNLSDKSDAEKLLDMQIDLNYYN